MSQLIKTCEIWEGSRQKHVKRERVQTQKLLFKVGGVGPIVSMGVRGVGDGDPVGPWTPRPPPPPPPGPRGGWGPMFPRPHGGKRGPPPLIFFWNEVK